MTHRVERLSNLLRQEISELIQRQVKDPRLGNFIAITEVFCSPDLKHARIFVSSIISGVEKKEILDTLTVASNFLRRELAKRVRLRYVPELSFHWDDSIERGAHIQELIDKVRSEETAD